MNEQVIYDMGQALTQLRRVCAKHGLPVPDRLSYSDPKLAYEAKMKIYSVAARSDYANFRTVQTSEDMQTNIAGFDILWT